MHRVFFGVKRLHWLLVKLSQTVIDLRGLLLTPARMDLLRVLHKYRGGIARFKLVRLLGVSGPVVSRMLKALESRRWLTRERAEKNRRVVIVKATEDTLEVLDELEGHGKAAEKLVHRVFSSSKRASVRRRELQILERFIVRARARMNDKAPFTHPWFGGEIMAHDGWLRLIVPPPTFAKAAPILNEVLPPLHEYYRMFAPLRVTAPA
jgi:DNA-binding MarR family transcriptional regulator